MNPDNPTYERTAEKRLRDWGVEIENLKERIASAPPEDRAFCQDRIERLETLRGEGFAKLRDIRQLGDEDWEALHSDLETLWDKMRRIFAEIYGKMN